MTFRFRDRLPGCLGLVGTGSGDPGGLIFPDGSATLTLMQTPRNIRVHRDSAELEIVWSDDDVVRLPFRLLRQSCRCAVCVDEFTGRRILDPETIPDDIHVSDVSLTGNYALKFVWSDQHDSGLYTWPHLRDLSKIS